MTTTLPSDFKEFLRLLDEKGVESLIVGGYAVGYHGYPRSTGNMNVWIDSTEENAERVVETLKEFGFDGPRLGPELFLDPDRVIRMGHLPLRIEVLTSVTGRLESAIRAAPWKRWKTERRFTSSGLKS
jgi:hypothetical protein